MLAVGVVALVVRLVPLLTVGGLLGEPNYDPVVYYASAVGLFRGQLPYRDFLLLHPPGILLVLQPFAALGQWVGDPNAFAAARVGFMLIGAGSAAIVFRLLLPQGIAAAVIGGMAYAVSPGAAHVERAPWLEAPASLLLLLGLLVLLRRRGEAPLSASWAVAGGALLAAAATMKLWGVVPLVLVVVWLVFAENLRAALGYILGAAAAGAAVIGPFLLLAGQDVWSDVVLAQLGRPTARSDPMLRWNSIMGFDLAQAGLVPVAVSAALGVAVLVAVALALRTVPGRLFALLLMGTVAVLLATPSWYANYAAFAAAPLALVVGSSVATITRWLPNVWRWVGAIVVAVVLAGAAGLQLISKVGFSFPGAQLTQALRDQPGCVTTDQPMALILGDRLRTNLDHGCRLVVDLSGYIHVFHQDGSPSQRAANPRFQSEMMGYLRSGEATVILSDMWPRDFSRDSRREVSGWPVIETAGWIQVRSPKG